MTNVSKEMQNFPEVSGEVVLNGFNCAQTKIKT